MNEAAQESAGGDDHRSCAYLSALAGSNPGDVARRIDQQILGAGFADDEIVARGEEILHRLAIELAVGLGARPAHRRTLALIQHAELNAGAIEASAASQPAWPPPMTMTSNRSIAAI